VLCLVRNRGRLYRDIDARLSENFTFTLWAAGHLLFMLMMINQDVTVFVYNYFQTWCSFLLRLQADFLIFLIDYGNHPNLAIFGFVHCRLSLFSNFSDLEETALIRKQINKV